MRCHRHQCILSPKNRKLRVGVTLLRVSGKRSMVKTAEAEPKTFLAKYYQHLSCVLSYMNILMKYLT